MHIIILPALPPYQGCMSEPRCSFAFWNILKVSPCPRAFVPAGPSAWTVGGGFLTLQSQLKCYLLR